MKDPIDPKTMTNGETYWIHIKPSQETKGYTGPAVYDDPLGGVCHSFKLPFYVDGIIQTRKYPNTYITYLLYDSEFEVCKI
jgi:hypothetical protein